MVKKYYKDGPSIVDPATKSLINESELRLDLEKRIKETEDSMELAPCLNKRRQHHAVL